MVGQLLGAGMGIAGGLIGAGKRKADLRAKQKEHDRRKSQYEQLDTSNVYANMENTMEDLTVNQQQAQFQAEQEQQGLSNTMNQMQGAAGGSGIAALAQSMAGMQSKNLQGSSALIGSQESGNQMASAQQAGNLQLYNAKGKLISRDAEQDKVETLYGQAQGDLANAQAAVDKGKADIMGGVGGLLSGGMNAFTSGAIGGGTEFGKTMQELGRLG
jgi:hypothetical protein